MPELALYGCTPEPLMSYLKGLGVLRLVAEQVDPGARGAWRGGAFVLASALDGDTLVDFLLEAYRPTPVAAPWAGGSGFFGQDNRRAVDAIAASQAPRLQEYRSLIEQVRAILQQEGQAAKPSNEGKEHLLRRYRRQLPDAFVEWMDCALVLQSEGQAFPPLLGTGGNDGRLDFTQNFMQRLVDLGFTQAHPVSHAPQWLRQALFAEPAAGLLAAAIGQFDPGSAGGPNATVGMEGDSLVNPWNFVLMIEGALLLAGSVARRLGVGQRDKAVFPFTVRPSPVGESTTDWVDISAARGEIWLPLWTSLASLRELRTVFAEGRAELSGRQSGDGVDFARAVAGLGVDRGITAFMRFGFLKRSGKAYLAAPLGRFEVQGRHDVDLLHEVDPWLDSFRRACGGDTVPARFASALRRIDAAIFDFCRYGGRRRMADVICALGHAERQLANGEQFRRTDKRTIQPVPPLSSAWIAACDDGSTEFRLALALASIRGDRDSKVGAIRVNLEPVERRGPRWMWAEKNRAVVWSSADLCRNLTAVLARRVMEASRTGLERLPLAGRCHAPLHDVSTFLVGETDDRRIEALLWGLVLIDDRPGHPEHQTQLSKFDDLPLLLPHAYVLLKLLFLPHQLSWPVGAAEVSVTPEPEILGRLNAGDVDGACAIALRRFRGIGLIPMPGLISGGGWRRVKFDQALDPKRLAAALLFSVGHPAELVKRALRPPTNERAESAM
jgi:CRISPR-associated protein Csx17